MTKSLINYFIQNLKLRLIFALFAFGIVSVTCGRAKDSSKHIVVQVLPSAFYTPETRIGIGASIYSYFQLGASDSFTKKSNAQTFVSATLNKQFSFENDFQLWFNRNKYNINGSADYSMFPELFFGIGNETMVIDKMSISFDLIKIKLKVLRHVKGNLYAGVLLHYQRMYNEDIDLMPISMQKEIYGTMGYNAKGVGLVAMLDKRDNMLNPAKGYYAEASYVDFTNRLNEKYKFATISIDLRKYATCWHKLIWNGNLHGEFANGKVPFRMLPELGGARFLRGYYRGRFRDNNLIVAQNEFRMSIYKRIGIAVFGGVGEVAHSINSFTLNQLHYNYGLGLRLKMNKKENANLRIDYGFTKDSKGLYVVFAEAF